VWEPHELKEVKYLAIAAKPLFDKIYGAEWKKAEDALFTCADGYQPTLSVPRFLKYDGYFAIERVGTDFTVTKKQEANVVADLGPLYLVWKNLDKPELRAEDLLAWPYQVVTIDFVDLVDRFPHMMPPKNASAAVKRGFNHFRQNCFMCHKVNGDGGDKSIDLNRPFSVTEYWNPKWLKRWITDPTQIRPGTVMPPFPTPGKEGEKMIDDLIAYLKVMTTKKD
jgi:cytochrome c2